MSYPEHPAVSPSPARRRPSIGTVSAVIGIVVSVLGLLVAIGQWLYPNNGHDDAETVSATTATSGPAVVPESALATSSAAAAPTTATTEVAAPSGTPLGSVPKEAAGALAALPRELKGKPGFQDALVIACPSNQSDDKTRTVTLLLNGRYLDLTATVQAYFPDDAKLRASVTAIGVWRERDNTLTDKPLSAVVAKGQTTATLTGAVDNAEKLRLQVACDLPTGFAIIKGGRLTEAS